MHEPTCILWANLTPCALQHPALLADVPTDGRSIPWDEIASAQYPTFGETQVLSGRLPRAARADSLAPLKV